MANETTIRPSLRCGCSTSQAPAWLTAFPRLAEIREREWLDAIAHSQVLRLPQGAVAFNQGDECRNYLLLLDGAVRVQQVSAQGREIMLYRLTAGQACVMTVSCLLTRRPYLAQAIVESAARVVAIPCQFFMTALVRSQRLQAFVFDGFSEKFNLMMGMIEQVAFGRIDVRLARHLLDLAGSTGRITTTHERLAQALGTHRVVVSRILKAFERNGLLRRGRGHIDLLGGDTLRRFVGDNPL